MAEVTDTPVETAPEIVADKGYHSRDKVLDLQTQGFRTYISEPDRGRQSWPDQADAREAVYANRRRSRGTRGRRLQRRRGEFLERPNAHLYDTGGMRRVHLRRSENILKRLLIHAGGFNLGLWMRTSFGDRHAARPPGRAVCARGLALHASWNPRSATAGAIRIVTRPLTPARRPSPVWVLRVVKNATAPRAASCDPFSRPASTHPGRLRFPACARIETGWTGMGRPVTSTRDCWSISRTSFIRNRDWDPISSMSTPT